MRKLTNLFKVVAVLFIALSVGSFAVVNAQGGSTANSANGTTFNSSCSTTTYGTVAGDSAIYYAPEQFSTVADAVLRTGTSFIVCTDFDLLGWQAFKITPQTPVLFARAGTFVGFGIQSGFRNQTALNNRGGQQQGSFANQNTVGGIGGTNQTGFNNNQGNFGNQGNNSQTGFNNQGNFSNQGNNSQTGFNNNQGNFGNQGNNSQTGFNNQGNTLNNSQIGSNNNSLLNRGISQNGNLGSQVGVNRSLPIGTIGLCSAVNDYHMVVRDVEISFAPQVNAGTGQFLRAGSVFPVCGDSNIRGWIAFKITPQSQIYFVPAGTFI
jgi:hypothetical protein